MRSRAVHKTITTVSRSRSALRTATFWTILCAACQNATTGPDLTVLLSGSDANGAIRTFFTEPAAGAAPEIRYAARNRFVDLLDNARHEILLWAYGLNEPEIIDALARAARRGLKVQIIGSPDQSYALIEDAFLNHGVRLPVAVRRRSGIQHVKLAAIDREIIFTGTGNFTTSGFFYNHNAFIEIHVDADHQAAFAGLLNALSHEDRPDQASFYEIAHGVRIIPAPARGRLIQSQIVRAIRGARHRLQFLIFSFTDPIIAAALYQRARAGIPVTGIFDDPGNSGELDPKSMADQLNRGLAFALARFYLEGNRRVFANEGVFHGGHLHHKTLLVDDTRVITGSYNWSLSARDRNLEVLLLIDDARVAFAFQQEFERIQNNAKLLGRSPLISPDAPNAAPQYETATNQICVPVAYAHLPLTIFAGTGAYRRAYHFREMNATQIATDTGPARCRDLAGLSDASTGINTGAGYLLSPAQIDGALTDFAYTGGPVGVASNPAVNKNESDPVNAPPCAISETCDPLEISRVDISAGWIWLAGTDRGSPFQTIQIWNRAQPPLETVTVIPLVADGDGFYRFAPPADAGSDALVFLDPAATGRTALGCVQSGAQLDPALREFLVAFAYERGIAPACATSE